MADETIDLVEVQWNLDRRRAELEAGEGKLRSDHSQAIGALVSKTVSTPKALASALTASLPTSAPGRPTPATTGNAISASSGKRVLDARQTVQEAKAALVALDADKAGSRLQAFLRPLERSSLAPVLTDDGNRETDWEVTGYRLIGPVPASTLAVLMPLVERMTKPAGPETVSKEALRCFSLTKSRERDGADMRLMAAALAEELAEFPADVVATAFRKWARREKWWPSLSEIREPCLREMRWRRSLKIALEDASRQP